MFGFLIVVFPTHYEGGALILRTRDKSEGKFECRTIDSSAAFAQHCQPYVAYVAFFSDVEPEVPVVKSGYRVTLTYNVC
ncbi:hypothetical protein A0H81_08871 [Grifola frondosa]|uniref:Uncharacterized protein n=1 Tax=Grifola frondosa TaxID=5627 RepID=A0A1C7M5P0_GRIFR|nr:hypothetical protein A0H81_08871 [Grifola frondosa]